MLLEARKVRCSEYIPSYVLTFGCASSGLVDRQSKKVNVQNGDTVSLCPSWWSISTSSDLFPIRPATEVLSVYNEDKADGQHQTAN